MKTAQQEALEQRRDELLTQLRAWPNFMRGAVYEKTRKCGRASCTCAKGGVRHSSRQLTVTVRGHTHTRYVRQAEWEQLSLFADNYKRLSTLIDELTLVNLELIRGEQPRPTKRKKP